MPHHLNSPFGKVIVVNSPVQPLTNSFYPSLVNNVTSNGNCHSHGKVNFPTTLPCNRCSYAPLYVQEICQAKSFGCQKRYSQCVKQHTCNHSNCNVCS